MFLRTCLASLALSMSATAAQAGEGSAHTLAQVQHIVVIYGENRSFDNLYGLFPGSDGITDALRNDHPQQDHDGKVLSRLPPVPGEHGSDPAFPPLANKPFRIDAPPVNKPLSERTRDLVHRYYQNRAQIHGGRNDRFAAISDAGGLSMGYYDGSSLPMWKLAQQFVLADHFFMAAYGGSFLNHFWLACACTPVYPEAPASMRAHVDASDELLTTADSPASALQGPPLYQDGLVTPDGYAVNTLQPPYQPSKIPPPSVDRGELADSAQHPLPPQTQKTLGDALSEKHVSWAWYAGGWAQAQQDRSVIYNQKSINFQAHHQPYNYFAAYAPGTAARRDHLKDGSDFLSDIEHGTLPQVAFYKPEGTLNEHPGYADVLSGDEHIADVVHRIQASPLWASTYIIVTYDENGGFWDHVPPPRGDRWGPGTRVPAIFISPLVKPHRVDHSPYDTTSILKFITRRFALQPLPGLRPDAGDLTATLR